MRGISCAAGDCAASVAGTRREESRRAFRRVLRTMLESFMVLGLTGNLVRDRKKLYTRGVCCVAAGEVRTGILEVWP